MGEDNVHSEIFDSLDYLIPPVKKSQGSLGRDLLFSRNHQRQADISLIKDFRRKITRIRLSSSEESDLQASTSVLFKKTTEELFHDQFSLLNLKKGNFKNNLSENRRPNELCKRGEKPMIKVTVIPKAVETQTSSKVFNKRYDRTKKLQSTVSNQENSIKNREIYFMVKGKRREKVYEIKTSESSTLSNKNCNTKYEEISLQQISNSKRLISSLNMEKKKHKDKKGDLSNFNENDFDCFCQNFKSDYERKFVNPRKSKVTIVGQLGLTRDDQYVLKCAATVNDKPIKANFVHEEDPNQNHIYYQRDVEFQKDSNNQTEFCYTNKCMKFKSSNEERKTSQATQVNMSKRKPFKGLKNQVVQCNCKHVINENNILKSESDDNVLKDCKSPLVIISVYPRNDNEDTNSPIKIIQHPNAPPKVTNTLRNNNSELNKYKRKKEDQKNDNVFPGNSYTQSPFRSRSPSPITKKVPNKPGGEQNTGQVPRRNNRFNTLRPRNINKSAQKLANAKKDVGCYCPYPEGITSQDMRNFQEINRDHNTNETDTKQVKRALVNNFLRSVDRLEHNDKKSKLILPKDNSSRIAINISDEMERYDVLFEQRNLDTGLTIRKTLKKQSQTCSTEDEVDRRSVENLLMLSGEKQGRIDKSMYSRETSDFAKVVQTEPRFIVRDSLEICHSREGRAGSHLNPNPLIDHDDLSNSMLNSDFLAPVKHYRGDNCLIPDPNERDREIRELLGIVRNKRNPKKDEPKKAEEDPPEAQNDKGCCCRRKCSSKGLMTGLSISKFFTSKCLKRKNKKKPASTPSKKRGDEEAQKDTAPVSRKKHSTDVTKKSKKRTSGEAKENATQVSVKKNVTETTQSGKKVTHSKETKIEDQPTSSESQQDESTPEEAPKEENAAAKDVSQKQESAEVKNVSQKEENVPQVEKEPTALTDIPRKEPVIEQNLILNRNIQIFLQVEQFTKQRPIVLTRKQYDKVKKTIQCTISKNLSVEQRKRCNLKNCNVISVGEIKVKPKLHQQLRYDREVQTEISEIQRTLRCIQIQTQRDKSPKIKEKEISKTLNKYIFCTDSSNFLDRHRDVLEKHFKPNEISPGHTVSSMEIRYANVAYTKHVTISSTYFGDGLNNNGPNSQKSNTSIHTIFKGHRKSATPNLGTSAYSLCSDVAEANYLNNSIKAPSYNGEAKPKKPFLQRLISCLVMRSAETSILKENLPARNLPSVNSSVDSYHISTSLGALEMTSSLYDTSASFYSNHTTLPLNKMKRGFFSSVRGFLTARRS